MDFYVKHLMESQRPQLFCEWCKDRGPVSGYIAKKFRELRRAKEKAICDFIANETEERLWGDPPMSEVTCPYFIVEDTDVPAYSSDHSEPLESEAGLASRLRGDPDDLLSSLVKMHERLKYDKPRDDDESPVWAYGEMMTMAEFLKRYNREEN